MAMVLLARGVLRLDDFRDAQIAVHLLVETTTIRVPDEDVIPDRLLLLADLIHALEVALLDHSLNAMIVALQFVAITMRTLALAVALDHGLREGILKADDDSRTELALSETVRANHGAVRIEGDWCVVVLP